jgi:hypothetical protein
MPDPVQKNITKAKRDGGMAQVPAWQVQGPVPRKKKQKKTLKCEEILEVSCWHGMQTDEVSSIRLKAKEALHTN